VTRFLKREKAVLYPARHVVGLLLVLAVAGCTPLFGPAPTPTVTPRPKPTPTPTFSTTDLPLVEAEAGQLVLERADLPAGFQLAGEEGDADKATVVYVRVAALEQEVTGSPNLLGVIADVEVYPDSAAAQAAYTANDPTLESITQDVQENAGETALLDVQPYAVTMSGTDTVIAYRVEYLIGLVPVVEYRYRWHMGNVVAGVIITARTAKVGEEPAGLQEQAQAIAERQVARIYRMAGGAETLDTP
jgi:hypothetical protein